MSEPAIGLDLGTTTVKAAIFDLAAPAAPLAVGQRPTPTADAGPGRFEMEPEALLAAVEESVAEALAASPGPPPRVLGISGTACGAWLVDGAGELTRRPILWNDGRAVAVVEEWVADGTVEEIFRIAGNVPYPGFTLPLLRWLREHEPQALDHAAAVLCQKDWLRMKLTGEVGQEETDASYAPCDIRGRRWSAELAELCGVAADAERLLPPLAEPDRTAPLGAGMARRLGLPEGLPVALGLTDIVAATVGGGAIGPGRAVTNFGTSAFSTVVTDECVLEPVGIGLTAAAPLGRWMRTMVNTSGSMTLDFAAGLVAGDDVERLFALAAAAEPGAGGVTFVPYLSPAGVVSPFVEPAARSTLAGMRTGHGPAEVARAAVEGLAAAIADSYAALPVEVETIHAVGGAARSDLLLQQVADFARIPVARLVGAEFGCRGAALVAGWAAGILGGEDELAAAVAAVERERRFEPGTEAPEVLRRYRDLATATRPLWARWEGGG